MDLAIPGGTHLCLFVGAALALLVTPGPAVLFIVARSVEQGRLAGLVSDLGIHAATVVHVLAAALGLSALLASSALAFSVVKYAGAAYLVWLGLRKILGPPPTAEAGAAPRRFGYMHLFRDGFVINLLNPKTALFFLAFLPQFVDAGRGHVATQIGFLGALFILLGLMSDGCYALAAGTAGQWLKRRRPRLGFERYVSGAVFIGLGLTSALTGNHRN
ncbi:MAG: LysE family translocator [Rhodospirillaceae bacterium]|nr:LysE family translocator [Rhodospirillaceae bacterium]